MSSSHSDYPLPDVTIRHVKDVPQITDPLFSGTDYQVSPSEYCLQVKGVGRFYACNGNVVEYSTERDADPGWVRLHLLNRVMVALLHQRKLINFHGSSFIYKDSGIMLLGETGAGKSSLTMDFVLNGASFMTDDLSVIGFNEDKPLILPLTHMIKLGDQSILQLNVPSEIISRAEEGTGKYYIDIKKSRDKKIPLDIILKLETGAVDKPFFDIPDQAERFSILRSEICLWEMLAGMPDTEHEYLRQLVQTVRETRMIRVVRPYSITIQEMYSAIINHLDLR